MSNNCYYCHGFSFCNCICIAMHSLCMRQRYVINMDFIIMLFYLCWFILGVFWDLSHHIIIVWWCVILWYLTNSNWHVCNAPHGLYHGIINLMDWYCCYDIVTAGDDTYWVTIWAYVQYHIFCILDTMVYALFVHIWCIIALLHYWQFNRTWYTSMLYIFFVYVVRWLWALHFFVLLSVLAVAFVFALSLLFLFLFALDSFFAVSLHFPVLLRGLSIYLFCVYLREWVCVCNVEGWLAVCFDSFSCHRHSFQQSGFYFFFFFVHCCFL